MAEFLYEQDPASPVGPRTAEQLRQSIAAEKELISETVERMGEKLRNTVDWRMYVREHPFLSLGAAASLGFLISGLFKRRVTPAEHIAEAINRVMHKSEDQSQNAIKLALVGILTKAATDWLKTKAFQPPIEHDVDEMSKLNRVRTEQGSRSRNQAEDQLII